MFDAPPDVARYPGLGVEIVADVAGPEDGQPVILLHGGGQTRASWGTALREGARRGYRMTSMDLRGHGDSGWATDKNYEIEAYAADLKAVADAQRRAPFLVGASMGGITSLVYAGTGAPLAGLVLVDIAPQIEEKGASRIGEFMRSNPDGFASLEEAADAVSAYLPHRPRPKDVSGLAKNLRLKENGRWYWHWDPGMLKERRDLDARAERLEKAARSLTVPTLLVRGGLSDVVSPEGVKAFLDLVPHAEFKDVAGADHMVAGDKNDAFNAALFDFLERHRA